jgi:D-xylose transport system substrate-binding protein
MRKALLAIAVVGMLATGSMTACTDHTNAGSSSDSGSGGAKAGNGPGKIGVILPDDGTTSQRWKTEDPKYLKAAFDAAGVPVDIQNAKGDRTRFLQLADQMIADGVKVLMIVNLDSQSGKAALDKARAAGVKTIDYDRLTLNGGAQYYVSFNNEQVGVLQAQELMKCLAGKPTPVVAELNGSPTDNNATLFKQGYDSVLQPQYDDARYIKGPDQAVDDWDNVVAGQIFQQMYEQQPKISGVVAANDGLANAVITVLRKVRMNGKIPVTGQDATIQGLQNVLSGDQCMTVFKDIKPEAEAAATLAIALYKGQQPNSQTINLKIDRIKDPESGAYLPFVSLDPVAVTKANIKDTVIRTGFVTVKDLCTPGRYAQLCKENGIT